MSKFLQADFLSERRNPRSVLIVVAAVVLFVLVLSAFLANRWTTKEKKVEERFPEAITLTPEEEERLVKEMSAPPDAKPTLSPKKLEEVTESMTAPPNAKPSLSDDELQKLLQSMSAQ